MTAKLNFWRGLLLLLCTSILATNCNDIQLDIKDIKDRLDILEGSSIATIDEQVTAITTSISDLKEVDKALDDYIKSLENTAADWQKWIRDVSDETSKLEIELGENVAAIKQSLLAGLNKAREAINSELSAIKATNAELKALDAILAENVEDLQIYVDSQLVSATNWANATFSTLARYAEIQAMIATIKACVEKTDVSLAALEIKFNGKIVEDITTALDALRSELGIDSVSKIENTVMSVTDIYNSVCAAELLMAIAENEDSMKSWVNERLAQSYSHIATLDGMLSALSVRSDETDAELQNQINDQKAILQQANAELTSAYKEAILQAIENNNGLIDRKISDSLQSAINKINAQLSQIDSRIQSIEHELQEIKDKLDDLLSETEGNQDKLDGIITLEGTRESGNLNNGGGITSSAAHYHMLYDLTQLNSGTKLHIESTSKSQYSVLWALHSTLYSVDTGLSTLVAKGELTSITQSDEIDLSKYPTAKFLYVSLGAEADCASVTYEVEEGSYHDVFAKLVELTNKPAISWIDDDFTGVGYDGTISEQYQIVHDWCMANDIKCDFAIIPDAPLESMTAKLAVAKEWENENFNFLFHPVHNEGWYNYSESNPHDIEKVKRSIVTGLRKMREYGLLCPLDIMVWPGDSHTFDDNIEVVKNYMDMAISVTQNLNHAADSPRYKIARIGIERLNKGMTVNEIKAIIDDAVAKGDWMIFYTHIHSITIAEEVTETGFTTANLFELLRYANDRVKLRPTAAIWRERKIMWDFCGK